MKHTLMILPLAACASTAEVEPLRPVHTYSIVARDAETGELGVAVQSHWFNVGPIVAWAEAGVGAVATQSFVNPSFGPQGLRLMKAGKDPVGALREMIAGDPGEAVRQVALVDSKGRVAAHTGSLCIAEAGHATGDGYSVQANMMLNDRVVPAMSSIYELTEGSLAERLLAALEAAQAAGGDIRGKQSAALLVVKGTSSGDPARDLVVDLRVDDHPDPIQEIRRLYRLHTAYEHMNAGDAAMEADDMERALAEYAAANAIAPDNVEMVFWTAFTLATSGELEAALPRFERAFEADANWVELLKRLPASELCDETLVKTILERTGR